VQQAVTGIGTIADRGLNPPDVNSFTRNHGVSRSADAQSGTRKDPSRLLRLHSTQRGRFILRKGGGRLSDLSHQTSNSMDVSWHDKASEYGTGKFWEQLNRAIGSAEVEFLEWEKLESKSVVAAATSIAKSYVLLVWCRAAEAALSATFLATWFHSYSLLRPKGVHRQKSCHEGIA
jgi:hypothetical protein